MSLGTLFALGGVAGGLWMLVGRAFSESARKAQGDNVEFGCLLLGVVGMMGLIGLAIDHLSVSVR